MESSEDEDIFVDASTQFHHDSGLDTSPEIDRLKNRIAEEEEEEDRQHQPGNDETKFSEDFEERFQATLESLGLEDEGLANLPEAEQQMGSDLKELKTAVKLFLNSQFREAEKMLKRKFKKSLYFTHGYAVLMTIKSLMTFDPADISNSLSLLKAAVDVAHYYRKKDHSIIHNLQGFVKGYSLDNMTHLQKHAELIYSEAYLLKAVVSIIHDESLVSLVREGVNIRFSYMTYKQCFKWMQKRQHSKSNNRLDNNKKPGNSKKNKWLSGKKKRTTESINSSGANSEAEETDDEDGDGLMDSDFVSGVRFGIGLFNLIMSLLPARALKLFEAIGFSGSREFGLQQMEDEYNSDGNGLRGFLCNFSLLAYHTIICNFITSLKPDLQLADNILLKGFQETPQSAFLFYFSARKQMMTKNIGEAIAYYQKSISAQKDWIQLHHICYWDMAICYSAQLNFLEASKCMENLERESRWSKAVYKYLLAAHLLMYEQISKSSSKDMNARAAELMDQVPKVMQRIAGKRIPIEKFVSRKARKYLMQQKRLLFPIFEMMIMWNTFEIISPSYLAEIHGILLDTFTELKQNNGTSTADDLCLLYLLLAIVTREQNKLEESKSYLQSLMETEDQILLDHYLSPFARFEYGRLLMKFNPARLEEAKEKFQDARKNYKKFSMENNLHFRIHNALAEIQSLQSETKQEEGEDI